MPFFAQPGFVPHGFEPHGFKPHDLRSARDTMMKAIGVTIEDDQLADMLALIGQRTGMPLDQLIGIGLWDFVRSFDWNYEEIKEGAVYQPPVITAPG